VQRISLIYTTGCRKYELLKQVLLDIGLTFKEVKQELLYKECVCRTFISPTILVDNDIIIFGGPRQSKLKKESSELAYHKKFPIKKN